MVNCCIIYISESSLNFVSCNSTWHILSSASSRNVPFKALVIYIFDLLALTFTPLFKCRWTLHKEQSITNCTGRQTTTGSWHGLKSHLWMQMFLTYTVTWVSYKCFWDHTSTVSTHVYLPFTSPRLFRTLVQLNTFPLRIRKWKRNYDIHDVHLSTPWLKLVPLY